MSVSIGLFSAMDRKRQLLSVRGDVLQCRSSVDQHGFADAECELVCSDDAAATVVASAGAPMLVVSDGTMTIYEGLLADRRTTDTGLAVSALGLRSALDEVTLTTEYSQTWGLYDSFAVTAAMLPNRYPDRFQISGYASNTAGINPIDGTAQSGSVNGSVAWALPDPANYYIAQVELTGEFAVEPSWRGDVQGYTSAWTVAGSSLFSYNNSGTTQQTRQISRTRIYSEADNVSVIAATIRATTSMQLSVYTTLLRMQAVVTVRLRGLTQGAAAAAVSRAATLTNTGLLPQSALLIQPSGAGVPTAFRNATAAAILDTLANTQQPPWVWGVLDGGATFLAPPTNWARSFLIDVESVQIERTDAGLANVVTATYSDPLTREQRVTPAARNELSIAMYGYREFVLETDRTVLAEAIALRDAYVAAHATPQTRTTLVARAVYDRFGNRLPPYAIRGNDVVTLRALPQQLAWAALEGNRFQVARATYDALANRIELEPAQPAPTVETMLSTAR